MTTIIKLKRKSVSGSDPTPSDLEHGELAINYADVNSIIKILPMP